MDEEMVFELTDCNGDKKIKIKIHSRAQFALLRFLAQIGYLNYEKINYDEVYETKDYDF